MITRLPRQVTILFSTSVITLAIARTHFSEWNSGSFPKGIDHPTWWRFFFFPFWSTPQVFFFICLFFFSNPFRSTTAHFVHAKKGNGYDFSLLRELLGGTFGAPVSEHKHHLQLLNLRTKNILLKIAK